MGDPEKEHDSGPLALQVAIPTNNPSFWGLWKFATPFDIAMVLIGLFFSVVQGTALPLMTLIEGSIANEFNSLLVDQAAKHAFMHNINHSSLYFVYIGVGILGSGALSSIILANRGEVIASRFRKQYLKATLHQNIAYFDKIGAGEITTRITNSTVAIQEAISEKLGVIVCGISTFVTAIIISFAVQAKLAAILLSAVVFIIGDMVIGSGFVMKYMAKSEATYSDCSSIIEEAISAIRTTAAFGIQETLAKKFEAQLGKVYYYSLRKHTSDAIMISLLWGSMFFLYALAFWEGSRILADGHIDIGQILIVVTAMLIGAYEFGNIAPEFQYIVDGISSLGSVNETIERQPIIDSQAEGKTFDKLRGHIQFSNVVFRYPSRPNVPILPNFSLEILPGQTVALVGSSGCGKSTCVGILERFYNTESGTVTIDGIDITAMNIKWLRRQIGFVSQEPTLFAVSILENILFGLVGTEHEAANEEKQRDMAIEACKQANAWDFIQTLDKGLDTNVGDRGFLLSGGQKQRIAIARAIVSNPQILLLDEATSALDTKSEGIVQQALDRAAKNRTTITIAHRLSTIRKADKIVVMAAGKVIEQGTHEQLLEGKGTYYELVQAQRIEQDDSSSVVPESEDYLANKVAVSPRISCESAVSTLDDVPQDKQPISAFTVISSLWKLQSKRDHQWIYLGTVSAVFLGYGYPAMAILDGKALDSMLVPASMFHQMRKDINLLSGMLFMVGWEQMAAAMVMILALGRASESFIRQIRLRMLRQFLRMDMSFFDDHTHTAGALTAMIARDGKSIEGFAGSTMGQVMQCVVIVVGGVIQAIAFNWRLGLVALALVPIMLGSGYLRYYILSVFNERSRAVYESSGALAAAYAAAVRTVQALTIEDRLCQGYNAVIDRQVRASVGPLASSGFMYGVSHAISPWIIALIYWYGSKLLADGKISPYAFFVVFIGAILGAEAAGLIFNFAPNMGKAKQASKNVFDVLNRQPSIDYTSSRGEILDESTIQGNVEFNNVYFSYPTRPQVPVLRGLSLSVKKGQFIALVGPSGCGKSTCIQLIEHFYNASRGQVTIDGHDIQDINVSNLRSFISLVQQEPLLYNGTVRENITYGWNKDPAELTDDIMFEVCKRANIHEFIMGLPDGYDTNIGTHGGLLSGGQKQRIAIARALIRNPKILLLDEATSALDSQSEKVVQAALDEAAKGRTTIAVAHRLSTIERADCIYVFDRGRIVERGTHEELLRMKGVYAELVRLQSLET